MELRLSGIVEAILLDNTLSRADLGCCVSTFFTAAMLELRSHTSAASASMSHAF